MRSCQLDHSLSDVRKKLAEQAEFLPNHLTIGLEESLTEEIGQETLNDIFHLLKKYDLASVVEREERDEKLAQYV